MHTHLARAHAQSHTYCMPCFYVLSAVAINTMTKINFRALPHRSLPYVATGSVEGPSSQMTLSVKLARITQSQN